jgi:hypothetical protein
MLFEKLPDDLIIYAMSFLELNVNYTVIRRLGKKSKSLSNEIAFENKLRNRGARRGYEKRTYSTASSRF